MSQAELIPSSKVAPNFPAIAYKGIPVLTTEMLAQAYGVNIKQIRQNFNNNRTRFIKGKHFFMLSGNELKEFKNYVENFDVVKIEKRTPHFILWTDRGSARHAKMLNSDRAWDIYELLEETFFRVTKPAVSLSNISITQRTYTLPSEDYEKVTKEQRRPIDQARKAWVAAAIANGRMLQRADSWKIIKAHFGNIDKIDKLPAIWIEDVVLFCQEMLNRELENKPEEAKALPEVTTMQLKKKRELPMPTPIPQLPSRIDEAPFLEFIKEVEVAHKEVDHIISSLQDRICDLCYSVGNALEKQADIRISFVKGLDVTNSLTGYLCHTMLSGIKKAMVFPDEHLDSYANPGYSLLGIVKQLNSARK